jgi:hypothetical protein
LRSLNPNPVPAADVSPDFGQPDVPTSSINPDHIEVTTVVADAADGSLSLDAGLLIPNSNHVADDVEPPKGVGDHESPKIVDAERVYSHGLHTNAGEKRPPSKVVDMVSEEPGDLQSHSGVVTDRVYSDRRHPDLGGKKPPYYDADQPVASGDGSDDEADEAEECSGDVASGDGSDEEADEYEERSGDVAGGDSSEDETDQDYSRQARGRGTIRSRKQQRSAVGAARVALSSAQSGSPTPASATSQVSSAAQRALPTASREQLEGALRLAIGNDNLELLRAGKPVTIDLFPGDDISLREVWLQTQLINDIDSILPKQGTFTSHLIAARQHPTLWLIAAWKLGATNVHAPPLDAPKCKYKSYPPSLDSRVVARITDGVHVALPWGQLTWVEDHEDRDSSKMLFANLRCLPLDGTGPDWTLLSRCPHHFEVAWCGPNALCQAMMGHLPWEDARVAQAVSRVLEPSRTQREVRSIVKMNSYLMTVAARECVLSETLRYGSASYIGNTLRGIMHEIPTLWREAVNHIVELNPNALNDAEWGQYVLDFLQGIDKRNKRSVENTSDPEASASKRPRT